MMHPHMRLLALAPLAMGSAPHHRFGLDNESGNWRALVLSETMRIYFKDCCIVKAGTRNREYKIDCEIGRLSRTHVTHVIFDFDGLLVDTESCYAIANQRLLQKFGREFTPEYNAMILGRKEDEAFPMLIKAVGIEDKITPKEYIAQFDAIVEGMLPKCKAMPGAEKLVRHLSKKGVPTAICTGSRGETFERKQKPHEDWLCLITLKVFCPNEPEIKRGKPYPDPYLTTMNRVSKTSKF
ncbi:hypothetical protein ANCCEY_04938 [Ancylostoma ceylanicum]|uniref:HAD hydrolase, family IA, variant 3 n=1 Tax=Ancylostoma ceylanicum TaxID=53326 RepID=A0A0D6LXN7_9BILA|nr:hypothetical protein ANCCEY_04938 [Ancylostoma ceylanicum]